MIKIVPDIFCPICSNATLTVSTSSFKGYFFGSLQNPGVQYRYFSPCICPFLRKIFFLYGMTSLLSNLFFTILFNHLYKSTSYCNLMIRLFFTCNVKIIMITCMTYFFCFAYFSSCFSGKNLMPDRIFMTFIGFPA